MIPAWQNRKKGIPPDIAALISNARVNSCWIFNARSKQFYTPEELEACWQNIFHQGNKFSNIKDFKIVTPLYAVRYAAQWVEAVSKMQQEIIKKLENYSADFQSKK